MENQWLNLVRYGENPEIPPESPQRPLRPVRQAPMQMDPNNVQAILGAYMDSQKPLEEEFRNVFETRQKQQQENNRLLDAVRNQDLSTYQQTDLSPLMALTDSLTGSNLSKGYKAPDNFKQQMALEQQALKRGDSLQNQELNSRIKFAQLKGQNVQDAMKFMRQQQQDEINNRYRNAMIDNMGARADYLTRENNKAKELSQSQISKLNEGNSIPNMLNDVSRVLTEKQDSFGPLKGRLGSANPYDTQSQAIDAQMRASSQAFGRYMEGGVLRKEDEEKYRRMFPNLSDTPEVAQEKLNVVKRLLIQRQNSDMDAFRDQGFNLQGVDKKLKAPELSPTITGTPAKQIDLDSMSDEELMKFIGE